MTMKIKKNANIYPYVLAAKTLKFGDKKIFHFMVYKMMCKGQTIIKNLPDGLFLCCDSYFM